MHLDRAERAVRGGGPEEGAHRGLRDADRRIAVTLRRVHFPTSLFNLLPLSRNTQNYRYNSGINSHDYLGFRKVRTLNFR